MKKLFQTNGKTGDLSIALIVAVLVIFGTIMIFSASYYPSGTNNYNPYYFLKRQLVWLAVSTVAMWFCAKVDYHFWARLWVIVPVICAILLVLVLVMIFHYSSPCRTSAEYFVRINIFYRKQSIP